MKYFSLYIHIPFCVRKCHYCDFTSFRCNFETIENYVDNLIVELSLYKDRLADYYIRTIFIGGGTPSSIDARHVERILKYVYENYRVDRLEEVSIEANPGTLDRFKVKKYKEIGVNRVSIGAQSLNNRMLKSIGRIHDVEDFHNSINLLRSEGFNNINVDLMFSLPGQTLEDLEYTLSEVIKLKVEHISLYSLIIEDNTALGKLYNRGLIEEVDEDLDREMYHRAIEILKKAGFQHYEVSNFSKKNYECKHNLAYWTIQPYLGVGVSSHSNLFSKRFYNYSDLKTYNEYINKNRLPVEDEEFIEKNTLIGEYMIMGLRLIEGINKEDYRNRFSEDINTRYLEVIKKNKEAGLLIETDTNISLTKRGLDLANIVEADFYNINE